MSYEQQERNFKLKSRLRDGVIGWPSNTGLSNFQFEVPEKSLVNDLIAPGNVYFFLSKKDACYVRLINYIMEHVDQSCDADAKVIQLRAQLSIALEILSDVLVHQIPQDIQDKITYLINAVGDM